MLPPGNGQDQGVGVPALWRDDDGQRAGPDRDRCVGGVGGGLDRGHQVRLLVGDVDGLAVRRDRDASGAASDRDRFGGVRIRVPVSALNLSPG